MLVIESARSRHRHRIKSASAGNEPAKPPTNGPPATTRPVAMERHALPNSHKRHFPITICL